MLLFSLLLMTLQSSMGSGSCTISLTCFLAVCHHSRLHQASFGVISFSCVCDCCLGFCCDLVAVLCCFNWVFAPVKWLAEWSCLWWPVMCQVSVRPYYTVPADAAVVC